MLLNHFACLRFSLSADISDSAFVHLNAIVFCG